MRKFNFPQVLVALFIGLLGAGVLWVGQPINNYLFRNSAIADDFFPALAVAFILILVFIVNPLLSLVAPGRQLSGRQLALIFAILLVAASPLMTVRLMPHTLARANAKIVADAKLNAMHRKFDIPDALYLDPDLTKDNAPVSEQLETELFPGSSIPWGSWFAPTLGWGGMILTMWLVMAGIALIFYPQWRGNERIPFPILTVAQTIIEKPDKGKRLPVIFRNRIFWIASITVIILHGLNGLNYHTGDAVPGFPLTWDLERIFTDGIWRHMAAFPPPWWGKILFIVVGITYFMPTRVAFSLWFIFVLSKVYTMIGTEYVAQFDRGALGGYRSGAIFGIGVVVLWLSRKHLGQVLKAMFTPAKGDEQTRNRVAGWIFLLGSAGFIGWMLWAGVTLLMATAYFISLFFTSLILARLVAETGIPFMALGFGPRVIFNILPVSWLDGASIYIGGFFDFITTEATSRVSAAVMLLQGLGMDRENKPRTQVRLIWLFLGVSVLGLLVAGAVHLWIGYNYSSAFDGSAPISPWGPVRFGYIENAMHGWAQGRETASSLGMMINLGIGFLLGALFQIGCLLSPAWPLHPAGLLLINSWYIGQIWNSVFFGWALKTLIVSYGGAQVYRKARPVFIGMVVGEVFSVVLWAAVPVVLMAMGQPPEDVGSMPIIPQ